jgi:hypothetical protein
MKRVLPTLVLALLASRPALAEEAPSYTKDVKPFLETYCTGCHNASRPRSGYNLDDYPALLKGGRRGPAVVAGKPDKSMLMRTLEGGAKKMPPRKYSERPTAKEIAKVKAWITAGAKDDSEKTSEKTDDKPAEKSGRRESATAEAKP